ncbi:hypothetical protein Hbl1158_15765 (plasmid) [Halobaculum sp. CBA1158]|uniref:DUF7260 family protein n=1 Tax=Halobaculum sp. CBA1158 TaxID=2904243 RepID=UPI001F19B8BC|nr:hypothetical protein [Halobaculum sp. CBA1158]UIP01365.1 hypothetical protein Hbl1158_15765 [Halobaculum sp. CBA1158]
MTIDTHIEHAQARVRTEQEAADARLDAYETFIRRVRGLETERTSASAGSAAVVGTTHLTADTVSTDRCRTVRNAFAETIPPHSVADTDGSEPLLETIREEFTDTIAVALAPTTDASLTPDLKRMVVAEARSRRSETAALQTALGRETEQLADAAATVDDIVAWIVEANETPLTDRGFDALKQRHETLASHRDRCEDVARERQAFLRGTTNDGFDAGIRHRRLVPYLYQELPVDHPVLATVTTLDETCRSCQSAVRDQLVRRA